MAGKIFSYCLLVFALIALAVFIFEQSSADKGPWVEVRHRDAPAEMPILYDGPESRRGVGPGCSAFVAHGLVNVPLGGMLFTAVGLSLLHRRRARARAAFDPRAPLRDGAAVIFGEIEPLPGHEGPVIEVRIEQHGEEVSGKGGVRHTWKEVRRDVVVHPFHVRRHDGTRVRVEPDERVVLEHDLGRITRDDRTTRTRIAELGAGKQVHICGELRGASTAGGRDTAYRDGARGPVLRAPAIGRMIISTERPGDTEAQRMRFHARWAVVLAGALAFLAGVVMPAYELLAFDGVHVTAEVDGIRRWKTWVHPKNGRAYEVEHYAVRARLPRPGGGFVSLEGECSGALYHCVERGDCTHAPFLVAAHAPSVHAVGYRPTLGVGRAIILFLVMFILGVSYPGSADVTRPWYAKPKIDDEDVGPLSNSKP